jgi:hypothetical protein
MTMEKTSKLVPIWLNIFFSLRHGLSENHLTQDGVRKPFLTGERINLPRVRFPDTLGVAVAGANVPDARLLAPTIAAIVVERPEPV